MNLECKTIKEILCGLDIQDASCDGKICKFNDMVSDFCTMTAGLNMSKVGEMWTGEGNKILQTSFIPKRVHAFYVKGKCIGNPCFSKIENCTNCHCDGLYMWHAQQTAMDPQSGQYQDLGQGEFKLNVPAGVSEGFMIYSLCPKPISSIDEEICLPSELMVGFRTYVRMSYAEYDKELQLAQYYETKLNRRLERVAKNDIKPLYRVYHPIVNG